MKRLTVSVTRKDGTSTTIPVFVDNETAKVLTQVDEATRNDYLRQEYEMSLVDRKESRRHQSLEDSLEDGFDVADSASSAEEDLMEKDSRRELLSAISQLTKEQQWLVKEVYIKGRSQTEIAKELDITHSAIRDRLRVIFKKIKKILNS